jgi:hypothetical protein
MGHSIRKVNISTERIFQWVIRETQSLSSSQMWIQFKEVPFQLHRMCKAAQKNQGKSQNSQQNASKMRREHLGSNNKFWASGRPRPRGAFQVSLVASKPKKHDSSRRQHTDTRITYRNRIAQAFGSARNANRWQEDSGKESV